MQDKTGALGGRGGGTSAKTKTLVALHALLALYSLSSVCGKLASGYAFMSTGFVVCYGGMIALMGIYALGWQQAIKRLPLTFAYANKAVTVIWGLVWGILIFNETVSPQKIAGCLIVLAGVVLYALSDGDGAGDEEAGESK